MIKQSIRCILATIKENQLIKHLKQPPQWSNMIPFIQLMLNNSNYDENTYTQCMIHSISNGASQQLPFDLVNYST